MGYAVFFRDKEGNQLSGKLLNFGKDFLSVKVPGIKEPFKLKENEDIIEMILQMPEPEGGIDNTEKPDSK